MPQLHPDVLTNIYTYISRSIEIIISIFLNFKNIAFIGFIQSSAKQRFILQHSNLHIIRHSNLSLYNICIEKYLFVYISPKRYTALIDKMFFFSFHFTHLKIQYRVRRNLKIGMLGLKQMCLCPIKIF